MKTPRTRIVVELMPHEERAFREQYRRQNMSRAEAGRLALVEWTLVSEEHEAEARMEEEAAASPPPTVSRCGFDMAWVGRCGVEVPEAGRRCQQHQKPCAVCGEPASHECDHTGQFVCGTPLCDRCEGYVDEKAPSGAWGFLNHAHRRKVDG